MSKILHEINEEFYFAILLAVVVLWY